MSASSVIGIRIGVEGAAKTETDLRRISGGIEGIGRSALSVRSAVTNLAGAFAGVVSAREFIQAADAVNTLRNSLRLATGGATLAAQAYSELFNIAQRSRVSFTELGGTFASISRASENLGLSQKQLLSVTEAIGNAVTISGSSAQASQAALVQLSQGLASGTLRGEELNSIMEQTPRLARAIADGLNVPIGKLREMGQAGELTAEKVIGALRAQSAVLAGEVQGSVLTVGQAYTQLSNSVVVAVGELDKATGASDTVAGALKSLATTVGEVGKAFKENREVIMTTLGVVGGVALAAGILKVASSIGAITLAFKALTVAMAANPAGLALLGVTAAVGGFVSYNNALKGTKEGMEAAIRDLEDTNRSVENSIYGKPSAAAQRQIEERKQQIRQMRQELALMSSSGLDSSAEDARLARQSKTLADAEKSRNAATEAWEKDSIKRLDSRQKMEREIAQIREIGLKAGKSEAEIEARVAAIRESYAKKGGSTKAAEIGENEKALAAYVSSLKKALVKEQELTEVQKARDLLKSLGNLGQSEQVQQLVLRLAEQVDAERALEESTRRQTEAAQAAAQAENERINALERSAQSVQDQVQRLLDEEQALAISAASNISLAQAIEHVSIARLQEQQAKLMAEGDRDAEVLAIQQEIDARRKLAEAIGRKDQRDLVKKQAEDAQKEWQKTADSIGDALTNALMRGFEDGKSFGENFSDSLVNAFKTYVARELQQSLARAISGAFGGQGGFNLGSLFGGGGQGGFNWGDLISKGWNYLTGGSAAAAASSLGTAAGTGFGVSAGGTGFGVTAAGTGYGVAATTAGATTVATTGAASGASAAGAGAMAAVPVVGWIAAAVMAADALYKKGYNRDALKGVGESKDYKYSAENAARGLLDGLGFSKKWADILSGTVRMASLFGRRLKQEGYEVDISGQNVDVEQYAYYKGGLFRSNKTVRGAADADTVDSLRFQVENVRESSKAMAQALGFSGEALDGFTGRMRINLKGAEDSAEAAKRYEEALMELQREMLNSVTGLDMSKDEFKRWIEGINQSIADAGISTSGIADILVQGMMGRLSQQEVGDQLADMIVGGIYNSIASNYAAQIASVFTAQIIQPIFVALAAGVPISQAISQQAIANVVQTAQQAAAAMNAIFSDPGFRQAIAGIEQAIGGVSAAVTSVRVPSFGSARTAARSAASQAADQEAQKRYQLETQLLQLLGRTGVLRQRELASLSAGNRELQIRIWALEDAKAGVNAAMEALQRAADAQRTELQKQLDAALESEQALNDVFQVLRDNIRELRGEVDSTVSLGAAAGRDLISQAIAGASISSDDLQAAIEAVRADLDRDQFSSKFERDRALLAFAGELESLSGVTEAGLSTAEQQVALLEEQLAGLDTQLELAQKQVDALFGVDTSVKTVTQAVQALSAAMATYTGTVAAASAVGVSTGAAPVSSGGGGYSGGGGGGYSAPKPAVKSVWTPQGYWDKNEDLRAYWTANAELLGKGRGWSRDDYLRWHWENVAKQGQAEMRAYAKGGYYPGGMALVGEEGPEIINFRQPGQVYTAGQTQELLGRGNDQMLAEIRGLREDNRAQSRAIAQLQARQAKLLERWNVEGLPAERLEA